MHHPSPPVTAYTTADVGRTIASPLTAALALGAEPTPELDPVAWLTARSVGVLIYPHGDGAITIHRAPVTTYRQGHGWVA